MNRRLRAGLTLLCILMLAFPAQAAALGSRLLFYGTFGDDVAELQATLARLGYDPGPIDGDFGRLTEQAVRLFQAHHGLVVDGVVGPATYAALRSQTPPARSGASSIRYIVQPGDSLYLIAERYGTTVSAIWQANGLTSEWIYPGQALTIPRSFPPAPPVENASPAKRQGLEVVGYYVEYFEGDDLSFQSFSAHKEAISTIAAFAYNINWDGSVSGRPFTKLKEAAKSAGKPVLALVHNIDQSRDFDGQLVHALLSNPKLRQTAVASIARLVRYGGYAGVNIDFENVPPGDRNNYTAFVRELAAELGRDGHQVTLSVPAKTWDDPGNAWSGAFDYRALGQLADAVMIMAYDEHWSGGPAGPVASLGWVKQVVEYAVREIPPEKIRLGLPAYGYDWPAGGWGGRAVTAQEAVALAARYGAAIEWDAAAQSPHFTYWPGGYAREVWFENASSLAGKLDLVAQYKLGGIALWRLGFEDPKFWDVLKSKFTIR
ncbi:MAG: spore germination protein [Bacillota bacterium]|nr:spore germination protein [Bacillota bacterium]MDK2856043.1 spore germination protein [Bacillota bacterium]MDK2925065.1 spore germination protein [Bacillota bacterium]